MMVTITLQSLEAAEQAQVTSQKISEQESTAKRETESALREQIAQLEAEINAKVF